LLTNYYDQHRLPSPTVASHSCIVVLISVASPLLPSWSPVGVHDEDACKSLSLTEQSCLSTRNHSSAPICLSSNFVPSSSSARSRNVLFCGCGHEKFLSDRSKCGSSSVHAPMPARSGSDALSCDRIVAFLAGHTGLREIVLRSCQCIVQGDSHPHPRRSTHC
jgi:hypothetical protein